MKKKVTAVLLSAFVLPGLGQFYLGRKLLGGILLVLVNVIILLALFVVLRGLSPVIASQISGGVVNIAPTDVASAIEKTSAFGKGVLAAFFLVWAFSVADVLRARPQDDAPTE